MKRSNWVTLDTELQFIRSYYAPAQGPLWEGIGLKRVWSESDRERWIPPLSLQAILSKTHFTKIAPANPSPLVISIRSNGDGRLEVQNTIQRRIISEQTGMDSYSTRVDETPPGW